METKVLKEILLEQGEIDRYYEGQVPTSLWRALNHQRGMALFELIEEPFIMSNGRPALRISPSSLVIRSPG